MGVWEALYDLGLTLLFLVTASFCDDYPAANDARGRLYARARQKESAGGGVSVVAELDFEALANSQTQLQLSAEEWRSVFEDHCDSDFQTLREFCTSIPGYRDAVGALELGAGAGWRLLFKMVSA